jgi:hypothetical protein
MVQKKNQAHPKILKIKVKTISEIYAIPKINGKTINRVTIHPQP